MYQVYTQEKWKRNRRRSNGRQLSLSKPMVLATAPTKAEAEAIAKEWNATHDDGFLGKRARVKEKFGGER
tara:strand:- start:15730 stop:15939 length:210 start_codon:yes stop_codon:yes gene_type:complete